jgi:hypothetical protein
MKPLNYCSRWKANCIVFPQVNPNAATLFYNRQKIKYLLAGTDITIHTDHHNLLSAHSRSDRVYRWKLGIQ